MATIKPIEGRSVHQIQSGQVIVDLQSVCKEVVENSIDAEIRFKNYGLDAIEVQDNGGGISPDDYETIALKHYTSKLSSYDDLSSLETFGFRGEALSSLCALSNFHIITARPTDGPKGTKLEFEQSGKLKGTSVVAAKQGTTVVVETLFYNLPVRRKELEKNIKREYSKVLHLLNAYACISVGVKFNVSNLVPKGKRIPAFSTNSNTSTKDNISNVYGAKTIAALLPLDLEFQMDPSNRTSATQGARNLGTQEDSGSRTVKIVGHISRPVVGEGRQTPDRQMFFVNSRPCNLPQVGKAFNEVYKSYNITQSPFIFADIQLDTNAYDVNVSPDKRTIMLHDQTALLENLKEALLTLFEGHDQSVPQAQLLSKKLPPAAFKTPTLIPRDSTDTLIADEHSDSEDLATINKAQIGRNKISLPPKMPNVAPLPGFVKASLIERFASRDAEDRAIRSSTRRGRSSSSGDDVISGEKVLQPDAQESAVLPDQEEQSAVTPPRRLSNSPLFEPEQIESPIPIRSVESPKFVQDSSARMVFQPTRKMHSERSSSSPGPSPVDEEPIPSVRQTPHKSLSQATIQNAFDRMRPMRTPAQQATITIGGTTVVSTIGNSSNSRSSRRSRIHTPKFSLDGTPLVQNSKQPLFMRGLRGFAAPGTQVASSDDEDEGDHDSDMRDVPARSPSLQKGRSSETLENYRSDEPASASDTHLPIIEDEPSVPGVVEEDGKGIEAADEDLSDEYIDEETKRAREEAKIAKLIASAEAAAARPTETNLKRANKLFKVSQNKYQTLNLETTVETDVTSISRHLQSLQASLDASTTAANEPSLVPNTESDPEERLSLTVTKPDFAQMRIIGQFNLGFIIAVRPPTKTSPTPDLFIIDQHASDEKYNFERLSSTTKLVSQRLVHPHQLELTAVERELILANQYALNLNGFAVEINTNEDTHTTQLTSLPMSLETTFTPADLEELLALLLDNPSSTTYVPRPSKVRKVLASRACRSSVMIGKTLTQKRMKEILSAWEANDEAFVWDWGVGWVEGGGGVGYEGG
ncbi:hypothetical protein GQ44DRAFT_733313 [Phaeosphaeriaceae sp. PMI808]|nr:hypothetical protein GQ44DRAFT_733313 [Phaeosphaeriaceae sp. PMI808]